MYTGTIVAESLQDTKILNSFNVLSIVETDDENIQDRWHIYSVFVSEEEITQISKQLKEKWYAHFWNDTKLIIIFTHNIFMCERKDITTWQPAIEYGVTQGIPKEQLDFLMN